MSTKRAGTTGQFEWNPINYHAVVRAIATLPPIVVASAARQVGSIAGLGGLSCPSPPWDIKRTYRVSGASSMPVIEVETTPGTWVPAEPLAHFQAQVSNLSEVTVRRLHHSIGEALSADDAQLPGRQKTYGVREFQDWRDAANILECELRKRGIGFDPLNF